ncbi:hypothetical protein QUF61_00295 [Candidatus Venteria ishoeyi]|uniref:hypothetical protein n=1 Tax=Candidatus Venteria ishoeyi TaxID=1899563 RepID=UPI0025A56C3B|nr:hypothetical protein [Candidatus Venteria ishoeyi]MDM8544909.1 hypothetical protein [Candidatus Venteria ishoeyi]
MGKMLYEQDKTVLPKYIAIIHKIDEMGNYWVLFEREDSLKIIDIIDVLHRKQAYCRR